MEGAGGVALNVKQQEVFALHQPSVNTEPLLTRLAENALCLLTENTAALAGI